MDCTAGGGQGQQIIIDYKTGPVKTPNINKDPDYEWLFAPDPEGANDAYRQMMLYAFLYSAEENAKLMVISSRDLLGGTTPKSLDSLPVAEIEKRLKVFLEETLFAKDFNSPHKDEPCDKCPHGALCRSFARTKERCADAQ